MGLGTHMTRARLHSTATALLLGTCLAAGCSGAQTPDVSAALADCKTELIVLGAGQDAGAPQIGNSQDAGWNDPALQLYPVSLGLVDHDSGARYLFDASPQVTAQLQLFDALTGSSQDKGLHLDGVFLTHAHIGHYAGLIFFGREAAGARDLPVYAMPRMGAFLRENGPWGQLVELDNISIRNLSDRTEIGLSSGLSVTPVQVPHRDEYSETVGYVIKGAEASALFVPDIDSWDAWQSEYGVSIDDMVAQVDYAFLDASFFDNHELVGRDMSEIPHPRVTETMALFADAATDIRKRIHFIHYNHTNPIRDPNSADTRSVAEAGFNIARRGDRICLGN